MADPPRRDAEFAQSVYGVETSSQHTLSELGVGGVRVRGWWASEADQMGEATGSCSGIARRPTRRPVPVRIRDWKEVYEEFPTEPRTTRPGAAWTAASRSATTAVRSATSSRTGTTSSTAITGATPSTVCTRRTTSRSSPGGCARRRARRRACSASTPIPVTIKQVEVEIIDRAWDEGWVTPADPVGRAPASASP